MCTLLVDWGTHTHTQPFNSCWSGITRVGQYQEKHLPTHTHPGHRTSFISFFHLLRSIASLCSVYVLDSTLWQPLSRSSLVFLLVLGPLLHTPCIFSPSHHLLYAAHAHTIAACSAVIPVLCHLYQVSLSAPYLGICWWTEANQNKLWKCASCKIVNNLTNLC